MAEALRDWMPTIVQSVEAWVSSQDIPAGGRGLQAMATELEAGFFGILCLTQENKQAPWIHFEAGALSKAIETSRVIPFLLDLKASDITGPLAQFQAVDAGDKESVFGMLASVAAASDPRPIPTDRLRKVFDALWPELEAKLAAIRESSDQPPAQAHRQERDILEELLALARNTDRRLAEEINSRSSESPSQALSEESGSPGEAPSEASALHIVTMQDGDGRARRSTRGSRRAPPN